MRSSIRPPQSLFFITAIILALLAFLLRNQTLDIHVHDTYYVIGLNFYFLMLSLLFMAFGIVYSIGRNIVLSGKLTWLHLILTLVSLIVLHFFTISAGNRSHFIELSYPFLRALGGPMFLVFVLAQILFLVNIIGGVIRSIIWLNKKSG